MKNLPSDFIYILITLNGCTAINGAENFKKHLFKVCPAIESELKIWFESDEKEFKKLNELLDNKFHAFVVVIPRGWYETKSWKKPFEIGFERNLDDKHQNKGQKDE